MHGLSFNKTAKDYDSVRPGYPEKMYQDIFNQIESPDNGTILDIGSGTGQAVLPLLEKGFSVTCLEPGKDLHTILKQKTARFKNVDHVNNSFEKWEYNKQFDLIIAGTSFHWLDLQISLPKIRKMLNPGGSLCLFWNTHPQPYTGFFVEVQKVYNNNFPPDPRKNWKELKDKKTAVISKVRNFGYFEEKYYCSYDWSVNFSTVNYLRLLNTFSDNLMLPEVKKETLFTEIKELIDSCYNGEIERPYRTELYIFQ